MARSEERARALRTRRYPRLGIDVLEARLLASVDWRFVQGSFGVFPGIGPIPPVDTKLRTPAQWTTSVLASVDQPLTQQYRIGLGIELHELGIDVAREALRRERQRVTGEVRAAYYALASTEAAVTAARDVVRALRERDALTSRYLEQQVVVRADALEVESRLAREEWRLLTAEDALVSRRELLNELLGRDLATPFRVASPSALGVPSVPPLDEARQRAVASRPEIREAQLGTRQADADVRLKDAEWIPDLTLVFRYLALVNFEVVPERVAAVGVLLTWEPWDWGRRTLRSDPRRGGGARRDAGTARVPDSRVRRDPPDGPRRGRARARGGRGRRGEEGRRPRPAARERVRGQGPAGGVAGGRRARGRREGAARLRPREPAVRDPQHPEAGLRRGARPARRHRRPGGGRGGAALRGPHRAPGHGPRVAHRWRRREEGRRGGVARGRGGARLRRRGHERGEGGRRRAGRPAPDAPARGAGGVTTDALPGQTFEARISRVASAADPATRNFDVEIAIPNPRREWKAGMIAGVELGSGPPAPGAPRQVLLPFSAIVAAPGQGERYAVYLVEGEGRSAVVRLRPVELGDVTGNRVAVAKGLAPGERVVTVGASLLVDGERVEVSP